METRAKNAGKTVLVSAALMVDADGLVLLAQRPEGKSMAGLWEFPGGKVADGETPEAALMRELYEELGIIVKEADFTLVETIFHNYADFNLEMPVFLCRCWRGTPQALEHQALAWVAVEEIAKYPMPPADAPFIAKIPAILSD